MPNRCSFSGQQLQNQRQVRNVHDKRFTEYSRRGVRRLIATRRAQAQIDETEIRDAMDLDITQKGPCPAGGLTIGYRANATRPRFMTFGL